MSIRTERVARLLQREIAALLNTDFSSEIPGLVTVTHVRVTADLGIAYVYVSILDTTKQSRDATFQHLVTLVPKIRVALASRIRHQVRKIAELKFFVDDTLDRAERMEEIFGKIKGQSDQSASTSD